MFKKAAVFTDIHFGLKGNSKVHNQDCEDFIDWYIKQAQDAGCETGIFCGDWHHNRNSLNLTTMDATVRCMEKLGAAFEQFFFFDGNHDLPDHGELRAEDFKNQSYVFSGHFHKRQQQGVVHYLGNAFPHNYADAWDDDRGMMILDRENNKEPEYLNWEDCPKYRTVKLSKLIDEADSFIKPNMYLRVNLDLPISYEEASFIKETFINQYNCREISLIPQKSLEEISTQLDIQQFESVDQIVAGEIAAIDSDNFNKKTLMDIYNEL